MELRDITATKCAGRCQYALFGRSTNSAARWIYKQYSLSSAVAILMKHVFPPFGEESFFKPIFYIVSKLDVMAGL
jgi:hypothetical protein